MLGRELRLAAAHFAQQPESSEPESTDVVSSLRLLTWNIGYAELEDDTRAHDKDPKVPSYEGGKFPLSTYLADRVRNILADHDTWRALPDQVREWLDVQEHRSRLPGSISRSRSEGRRYRRYSLPTF